MKKVLFIILYLIFILPHLVHAGIVIEEIGYRKSYSKSTPSEKEKTITYISRNRIKVVESDGSYELWDLNKGTFYMVNPHQKSYTGGIMVEEFIREIREMKEGIRKMQEEMGKFLEKTPPAKPTVREKVTVKNTGQVTTIAGYPATKYAVYRNGKLDSEVWIAPKLEVDIKKELDYKRFEKLERELERVFLEAEFGPGVEESLDILDTTELDLLYEKGFVVKEIDYSFDYVTEVIKIKKMALPDMEFVLPSGYKKVSAQEFMELEEEK